MSISKRELLYQVVDGIRHRRCASCFAFHPESSFYRSGRYARSYCRDCHSRMNAQRYATRCRLAIAA